MDTDPDDISTRALLEPATQALLARLKPQDCEGIPSEVVNADALLDRVCEVLGVPLVDLLRTVETLPRWVSVESVKDGTVFYATSYPPDFPVVVSTDDCDTPVGLCVDAKARADLRGGYVLIGNPYPPPPKVTR